MEELVLSEDGKTLISCSNNISGHLVIPDDIEKIECWAFAGCTGLTTIKIPNGVTEIGSRAFEDCTGLTFVEIPDSVTNIDYEAFFGCTAISQPLYNKRFFVKMPSAYKDKFNIPDGIETICNTAFQDCSNLTDIVIPDSVTVISDSAFEGCTGLTSIVIPNSVTAIFDGAFEGCTGLTSIEIPASVNYIAKNSLSNIGPQLHISVDLENQKYLSLEGSLYSKDGSILYHYCEKEIDEFTIPSTVTTIASCAFEWSYLETVVIGNSIAVIEEYTFFCAHIEKVYIPDTIKKIGSASFVSCEIKEIHIRHAHPEQIKVEEYAFGKTAENCTLFVPMGTDYAYRNHPVFGKFKDVKVEE